MIYNLILVVRSASIGELLVPKVRNTGLVRWWKTTNFTVAFILYSGTRGESLKTQGLEKQHTRSCIPGHSEELQCEKYGMWTTSLRGSVSKGGEVDSG